MQEELIGVLAEFKFNMLESINMRIQLTEYR